jgi:hypothetical protein
MPPVSKLLPFYDELKLSNIAKTESELPQSARNGNIAFLIFKVSKYFCLLVSLLLIVRTGSKKMLKVTNMNHLIYSVNMLQMLSYYALIDVYFYGLFDGILKNVLFLFRKNNVFHTGLFRFLFELKGMNTDLIENRDLYFDTYSGKGSEIQAKVLGDDVFDTLDFTSFYCVLLLVNLLLICSRYGKRISALRVTLANLYMPKLIGLFYSYTWTYGRDQIASPTNVLYFGTDALKWKLQCVVIPAAIVFDVLASFQTGLSGKNSALYPKEVNTYSIYCPKLLESYTLSKLSHHFKVMKTQLRVFSTWNVVKLLMFLFAFGFSVAFRNLGRQSTVSNTSL